MLEQRVQQQFFESADLQYQAAETLARPIADAAQAVVGCLTAGGRLLVGGIGRCAPLAELFGAALLGRFERERPPLACVTLTGGRVADAAANVLVRQIQALGQSGDLLLLIEANGPEGACPPCIDAAHAGELSVVVLSGPAPPGLREQLGETDVLIAVPHARAARINEAQLLVLHCLCDAIDLQLLGEQDTP
jgi:D-sedoheptulose 7-phosphate isomerase